MKPRIVVMGSLNMDHNYAVERIPLAGETVSSHGVELHFGGKGANQAVAAKRAGGEVEMIGVLGGDDAGLRYRERMVEMGIGGEGLFTKKDVPTGSAVILVDRNGENLIVVDAGANGCLTPEMVDESAERIAGADLLLMQFECPLDAVARASQIAKENETLVILNPSPWRSDFDSVHYDHLILNQHESDRFGPEMHGATFIVTRGADATRYFTAQDRGDVATQPVSPVDTVGAGDSFAGAYAVAIGEGKSVPEAVAFANAAGALATTQMGAQVAIPTREAILKFLKPS